MEYSKEFREFVERCKASGSPYMNLIGQGNPMSPILIVGQEPSGDACEFNSIDHWLCNLKYNRFDEYIRDRRIDDQKNWKAGSVWRNYQRLIECVFSSEHTYNPSPMFMDFESRAFITEASGIHCKSNRKARLIPGKIEEIVLRKEQFFKDPFIQSFPVVILACGNYFSTDEIAPLFCVMRDEKVREYSSNHVNHFSTHYNDDASKLVIHTRNLSNGVSKRMLEDMGRVIAEHLNKNNIRI